MIDVIIDALVNMELTFGYIIFFISQLFYLFVALRTYSLRHNVTAYNLALMIESGNDKALPEKVKKYLLWRNL